MVLAADRVIASNLTLGDWIGAAVIFGAAIIAGRVGRGVSVRAIGRGHEERAAAQVVGRMVASAGGVGGLVYSLSVPGVRLGPPRGAPRVRGGGLPLPGPGNPAHLRGPPLPPPP